ncbi:DUF4282 domain-containing protein [Devosia honganensis]|uniref:DUF4282 domain-containing protein n=1 Tax=Devosia honganensis TaxID=1610527 RepID=A0ABV7X581_9HYPH
MAQTIEDKMTLDDLKRLLTRQTLFRLDAILAPRLMPILYALGLAAILLWAISHFFFRFGTGFGDGLWGLLEIVVFGLFAFIALRIGCEALLVWFKSHEAAGDTVQRSRYSASLLDEVRDAIRDLAEEGEEADYAEADEYFTPATEPVPHVPPAPPAPPAAPATPAPAPVPPSPPAAAKRAPATRAGETHKPRRTAKRTPPKPPA